jgi:hypothetical protein
MATDPKAAKIAVWGSLITSTARAKTAGMTIAARVALFSEDSPGSAIRSRGIRIRPG